MDYTRYIEYVIDDIGAPKHLKGYNCLYYAIEYQLNNPGARIMDTYIEVAKILNMSRAAVERNIRHLIRYMFTKLDNEKLYNYFGTSVPTTGIVTNNQFIVTLAIAAKRLKRTEDNNDVDNGR